MSDSKLPEYEMDLGDEPPSKSTGGTTPTAQPPEADERLADVHLNEQRKQMLAHIESAQQTRNLINMDAIILAGLCGQGLCALLRIDQWSSGVSVAFLATLVGLGWVGWMWRRTLLPILKLDVLPLPLDDASASRMYSLDVAQRQQARQRRENDIAHIELCVNELSLVRPRLGRAVRGAIWGAICGWVIAIFAPAGIALLAASVGASIAAACSWSAAHGAWTLKRIRHVFLVFIPLAVFVIAMACDSTPWWTISCWLGMTAIGWQCWRRLVTLSGLMPIDGLPDETEPDDQSV